VLRAKREFSNKPTAKKRHIYHKVLYPNLHRNLEKGRGTCQAGTRVSWWTSKQPDLQHIVLHCLEKFWLLSQIPLQGKSATDHRALFIIFVDSEFECLINFIGDEQAD
jgi:hypothetical protein